MELRLPAFDRLVVVIGGGLVACASGTASGPAPDLGDTGGEMTGSITTLPVTTETVTTETATNGMTTAEDATGSGPDSGTSTVGDDADDNDNDNDNGSDNDDDDDDVTSTGDLCGNAAIDDGEDCDGDDLGGVVCADLEGYLGGDLACASDCSFDTRGCTTVASPGSGEVIFTEIMQNPAALADNDGEWFELHNPGSDPLLLGGCVVEGNDNDDGFEVGDDLLIAAGGYVTLANDSAGGPGFAEDQQWPGGSFSLNNASDIVRLVCGGTVVDEVSYDDGATFPDPTGASMSLDPGSYDAGDNDLGGNWCEGSSDYNIGDLGTPGADNDPC